MLSGGEGSETLGQAPGVEGLAGRVLRGVAEFFFQAAVVQDRPVGEEICLGRPVRSEVEEVADTESGLDHPDRNSARLLAKFGSDLVDRHRAITRHVKRGGKICIRVFPDKPITQKPLEVRQGKGKGSVEYWVAQIQPGRIMFEIEGVDEALAREAFALASAKLPFDTAFVKRTVM